MSKITLLHNPRCSKSRQALQLLQENNLQVDVVEYLKAPLSPAQLAELQKKLGLQDVRDMMRSKEDIYKELGLNDSAMTNEQLHAAIAEHPILLERPIAILGNQARIGRPPELVLELI